MKKMMLLLAVLASCNLFAQNESTLKIFLNCNYCDITYIKQNLDYVEFVRDQKDADVHLLFRTQVNGSGGTIYEIEFIGQNNYSEVQDKLTFSTNSDSTDSEIREMILKYTKLGLVRYWLKNGTHDKISVEMKKKEDDVKEQKDVWNNWVFDIGLRGHFYGQESNKTQNFNFSVTAKQVTDKNKFYLRGSSSDSRSVYTFDGTDIISSQKSSNLTLYDVVSINNHWSTGVFAEAGKSTYRNKAFYASLKPAIEYNFFSYEESSKKQLTLAYKVGGIHTNYNERTIFNKEKEFLWEHNLSLGGSIKQKWGSISSQASYESFLKDPSLNAFSFYLGTNFRIVKGLSVNVSGNYDITNNQINLAAGDLSLEELLLSQKQVKSGYNYFFSVGLNYSFGSMFNTIVNPRFNF
ncbi:MAG: hypothetical protein GZ086_13480 [Gelidibacter sp.]|nr:hypothetical protein [Gelidibacter sp.]